MSDPEEVKKLLGKNVVVTLDERYVDKGRLLAFNQWGEIVLSDDMGGLHFCWPMLDVKEDNGEP